VIDHILTITADQARTRWICATQPNPNQGVTGDLSWMFAGFGVLVVSTIILFEVLLAFVRSVQLLDNSTVVSNVLCRLQGLLRQQHAYDDQTPKVVIHKLDLTVAKQT
jgi:hypothetical protein